MSDGVKKSDNLLLGLRRLLAHLSSERKRQLLLLMALTLLGAFGELVTLGAVLPFLTLLADPGKAASYPFLGDMFSAFGWNDRSRIVVPATILFASVALGAGAIRLLLTWVSQRFVFKAGHDLGVAVYRRTLYQAYIYHVSHNSSNLIAAVTKVDSVVNGTILNVVQMITALVISAFIIAALVVINPAVALSAAVGFGLIYITITYTMRRRIRANSKIWAVMQNRRVNSLQEGLGGIRDVIIDQMQSTFIDKYASHDSALRNAQAMNAFIGAAPRYIIEACGMVLIAVMALILSRAGGGLVATLPVLGALALGAQRLLPLLQQIYNGWTIVATNRQSLYDVLDVLDLPAPSKPVPPADISPLSFKEKISFEDVGFRYASDRSMALHHISLTIRKGARVGLVGKTGSGKSTIVDLVMGLLEPTTGTIRIDGVKLKRKNIQAWQAQIAHVPQAIYLADASIAENIAFGVPEAEIDSERVQTAARRAELGDFIESLPQGYGTVVGERGIRLSGGQRQRIGIARALYKKATVLVFDEATSALDNETEKMVMGSIEALGRDLTILIVAHRLSTVEVCDHVFRLQDGRLVGEYDPRQTKSRRQPKIRAGF